MTDLAEFIRRLPKAELHLHLEGTILPATLVELSRRDGRTALTSEQADAVYHFTDFSGFMNAFRTITNLLVSPEDYELAAWRMAQRLAEQGVAHAEVYISVGVIYHFRNHDPACFEPIFEGLERARARAARELSVSIYWIFDAVRHFSVEEGVRVFRKAAELRPKYPSIIGIGLGGDERRTGSELYRTPYAVARSAGLRLTNHAGETTGPEAIREALAIGTERIGHALSAIRDPELIEQLRRDQIPLELNPTSNVRTGVCTSFAEHPLRKYFDAGLLVTLNSDDPAFFGSDLENEYRLAAAEQGFSRAELKQLASNSFRASFLPIVQKASWVARVASTE